MKTELARIEKEGIEKSDRILLLESEAEMASRDTDSWKVSTEMRMNVFRQFFFAGSVGRA